MTSPKAGKEMVLDINPKNEIRFKGSFTHPVTAYLYLTNPTKKSIAFKVKTTAPEWYQVKPVIYTLKEGELKTVTIMLNPLIGKDGKEIGPFNRTSQKFMVQAAYVEGDDKNIDRIIIQAALKGTLMKSTFNCFFEEKLPLVANIEASNSNSVVRSILTDASNGKNGIPGANIDEEPNTFYLIIYAVIVFMFFWLLSKIFGGVHKA